jgi:hypothetical protein
MKFPTLSKAHMQQNVNLALSALVKQGISLEGTRGGVVTPRDIVEGHRERTFGLLWKLVLNWKVAVLLDLNVLESEIAAVKTEYRRLYGEEQPDRVVCSLFHLVTWINQPSLQQALKGMLTLHGVLWL